MITNDLIVYLKRLFAREMPPNWRDRALLIAEDDPHPYRIARKSIVGLTWLTVADTAPEAAEQLKAITPDLVALGWQIRQQNDLMVSLWRPAPKRDIEAILEVVYMPEYTVGQHLPSFVRRQTAITVRNGC